MESHQLELESPSAFLDINEDKVTPNTSLGLTSKSLSVLSHNRRHSEYESQGLLSPTKHRRSHSDITNISSNTPSGGSSLGPITLIPLPDGTLKPLSNLTINPLLNFNSASLSLFSKGFMKFFESGLFSDLLLIHLKHEYHVHQLVLVHSSNYFQSALQSSSLNVSKRSTSYEQIEKILNNIKEEGGLPISPPRPKLTSKGSNPLKDLAAKSEKKFLKLSFPDPDGIFPSVLRYMYEGTISLTVDNALQCLHMANYLQIEDLILRVNEYLGKQITRSNVVFLLKKALDLKIEEVYEKCILVLSRNFTQLYTANVSFNFLPLPLLLDFLKHGSLTVASEFHVYDIICKYLKSSWFGGDENNVPLDVRKSLFENVHFLHMNYNELELVQKNPLVPQELLTEALMIRLAQYECPEKIKNLPKFYKRASSGILLEYTHDFDENGVFYYIGTKRKTAKWRNPCLVESGLKLEASSIEKGEPISIVGQKAVEFWTKDIPASWVCFDLGPTRKLLLTYYTLRHGGDSVQDFLRNWAIQASDDNGASGWTVLQRQRDNSQLNYQFATSSWPVNTCIKPYRYFRILQTGRSASNRNFLSISGIELYGELYETEVIT